MANIIYPDSGLTNIANRLVGGTLYYRLFTNDITPAKASVVGDFTEPAVSGYARQTCDTWTFSTVVLSHGVYTGDLLTFTNDDVALDLTIYGLFVTLDDASLLLAWAQRFDSPVTMGHGGGTMTVQPYFGDYSANP